MINPARLLIVLALTLHAGAAVLAGSSEDAAGQLKTVFAQLGQEGVRRAEFVEIRKLGELDMPIESRGELRFDPPATLIRQTLRPIEETLTLTGDSLSVRIGDTTRDLPLDAVPAAAALATALRGLLAGNQTEVESSFSIRFDGNPQAWKLILKPLDKEVAASMEKLVVQGSDSKIYQIDLSQTNGDESMMRILDTP